jgi:hypothetical protein
LKQFLKEKEKNHKLFQIMCNKILFNKKFTSKNNKIIFPIFGKNKITSGMLMKDFIVGKTAKNNYNGILETGPLAGYLTLKNSH